MRARLPFLLLLMLLAAATPARAQTRRDAHRQAKKLFLVGQQAFAQGNYDLAISRYLEAYRLAALPELLFNVGQAYRLKARTTRSRADLEQALLHYERYLKHRSISYREEALEFVGALSAQLASWKDEAERISRQRAEAEQAGRAADEARRRREQEEGRQREERERARLGALEQQRLEQATREHEARLRAEAGSQARRRRFRVAALVTGVAGLALTVTGAKYAADNRSFNEILAMQYVARKTWDARADTSLNASYATRRIAIGTLVSGGALLATSSVLAYLGFRRTAERAGRAGGVSLAPVLARGQAGATLEVRF